MQSGFFSNIPYMIYIEVCFQDLKEDKKDILLGWLTQWDFIGMQEEEDSLKVYFEEEKFFKVEIENLARLTGCELQLKKIEDQNWNTEWESNFKPLKVADFCGIRAAFYPPFENVKYDLIITPKMAFGTGHHATTAMMIEAISQMSIQNKTILDFGCGTGILSILASKMGAKKIQAIDNDQWAIDNARDNIKENKCSQINISNLRPEEIHTQFDCIFANINRNVLLSNMNTLHALTGEEGYLLVSGFLVGEDEIKIKSAASDLGFKVKSSLRKKEWSAVLFQK